MDLCIFKSRHPVYCVGSRNAILLWLLGCALRPSLWNFDICSLHVEGQFPILCMFLYSLFYNMCPHFVFDLISLWSLSKVCVAPPIHTLFLFSMKCFYHIYFTHFICFAVFLTVYGFPQYVVICNFPDFCFSFYLVHLIFLSCHFILRLYLFCVNSMSLLSSFPCS